MSPPTIRLATLIDIPAIATIYQPQVIEGTATFELAPPDQAEMRRRFETITASGFPYLAAETDGRLAGYAYAQAFRARPAYRFTVEDSIYVAEGVQGRGIGKALLSALVDRCTDLGFRQMIAVIGDSANAGSIAVHTRAGFELIGIHRNVGFKFGRWLDTVMMQRALGDGGTIAPVEQS